MPRPTPWRRSAATSGRPTHGINLAFLAFVFRDDLKLAAGRARGARDLRPEPGNGRGRRVSSATEGEAQLILGQTEAAFTAYRRFVAAGNDPAEGRLDLSQRAHDRGRVGDRALARKLGGIFDDPKP